MRSGLDLCVCHHSQHLRKVKHCCCKIIRNYEDKFVRCSEMTQVSSLMYLFDSGEGTGLLELSWSDVFKQPQENSDVLGGY